MNTCRNGIQQYPTSALSLHLHPPSPPWISTCKAYLLCLYLVIPTRMVSMTVLNWEKMSFTSNRKLLICVRNYRSSSVSLLCYQVLLSLVPWIDACEGSKTSPLCTIPIHPCRSCWLKLTFLIRLHHGTSQSYHGLLWVYNCPQNTKPIHPRSPWYNYYLSFVCMSDWPHILAVEKIWGGRHTSVSHPELQAQSYYYTWNCRGLGSGESYPHQLAGDGSDIVVPTVQSTGSGPLKHNDSAKSILISLLSVLQTPDITNIHFLLYVVVGLGWSMWILRGISL